MATLTLKHGDCTEVLLTFPEGSLGGVVSDPPYGLTFMGKGWDDLGPGQAQREWHIAWLSAAYRALKPGGVIKAFSGTRTFHHLAAAMAEVGFTGLHLDAWTYGSGFPKSLNVSKALDKAAGQVKILSEKPAFGIGGHADDKITEPVTPEAHQWDGWGTALKPAWEPVVVGRKPE